VKQVNLADELAQMQMTDPVAGVGLATFKLPGLADPDAVTESPEENARKLAALNEKIAADEAQKEKDRCRRNAVMVMAGAYALLDQKKHDEAFELCILALQQDKDYAQAHNGVGICLRQDGEYENAAIAFQDAIRLKDSHRFRANLASLKIDSLTLAEGIEEMRAVLKEAPEMVEAHIALTIGLLASGQFEEGWKLFADRWKLPEWGSQIMPYGHLPAWDKKTPEPVLIVQEEGPGERILFSSIIPDLIAAGVTPIIEATPKFDTLNTLFRRSFPGAHIGRFRSDVDPKSYVLMGDLGAMYRQSFDAFPKTAGYLKPDPARVAELRAYMKANFGPGPYIGLSWHSIGKAYGKFKSVPWDKLWPLTMSVTPGCMVNLQYGLDEKSLATTIGLRVVPGVDVNKDFDDLAALIAACDMVVTVSNSVAHLAGAVGTPTILLASGGQGLLWYWFRDREDSPWYPNMKIIRQDRLTGWGPVIDRVSKELMTFTGDYNGRRGDFSNTG
jgi:tetratricopeptide (TPR) repeat protein